LDVVGYMSDLVRFICLLNSKIDINTTPHQMTTIFLVVD